MTLPEIFGRRDLLDRLAGTLAGVAETGRGRMLAIRGRRQVGKSTVATAFLERQDAGHLYTVGVKGAPTRTQLARAAQAARTADVPMSDAALLFAEPPGSWRDLFGRIAVAARSGPVIVILDEFPWMVEADPTLEGELQVQWDGALQGLPVLLMLIGSDVSMMARLSEHDRPLFGRTEPLVVPALNPADVADALPGRSALEAFDSYLVTGGYPRLVASCARHRSAVSYVRHALLDPYSDLASTARLSLDAEFADADAAARVLAAIGGAEIARPGFNDVVSAISDPDERDAARTATTRALGVLTTVKDVIRVEVPSGAASNSKLRRYRITDAYLRFWFRFVQRQLDNVSRGRADLAVAHFDDGWTSWRGRAIEPVVHDALTRLGATDPRLDGADRVSSWWNRDNSVEVDLVARRSGQVVAVGTIKWRSKAVTRAEVEVLAALRSAVPGAEAARLLAVTATPPASDIPVDALFGPEDLLSAWRPGAASACTKIETSAGSS